MTNRRARARVSPNSTSRLSNEDVICFYWRTGECLKGNSCDYAHHEAGVISAMEKQSKEVVKPRESRHDTKLQSGVHTMRDYADTQTAQAPRVFVEVSVAPVSSDHSAFPPLGTAKATVTVKSVDPATRKAVNGSIPFAVDGSADSPSFASTPSSTPITLSLPRPHSPTNKTITANSNMELLPGPGSNYHPSSEVAAAAMRTSAFHHHSSPSLAPRVHTPTENSAPVLRVDTTNIAQDEKYEYSNPVRPPPGLEHVTPRPPLSDGEEDTDTGHFVTTPTPNGQPAKRLNPNAPQYTPRTRAAMISRTPTAAQMEMSTPVRASHSLRAASTAGRSHPPFDAILPTLPYSLSEMRTFRSLHFLPESGLPKVAALPPSQGLSSGPIMVTIGKTLVIDPNTPHNRPSFHNQVFRKCVMVGCNLTMCDMDDCTLVSCSVNMSEMWHGTAWLPNEGSVDDFRTGARAGRRVTCEARKCEFRHCEIRGGRFTDSIFGGCELADVDLGERCRVWNKQPEERQGSSWQQYPADQGPVNDRQRRYDASTDTSVWDRPRPEVRNEWQEKILQTLRGGQGPYDH